MSVENGGPAVAAAPSSTPQYLESPNRDSFHTATGGNSLAPSPVNGIDRKPLPSAAAADGIAQHPPRLSSIRPPRIVPPEDQNGDSSRRNSFDFGPETLNLAEPGAAVPPTQTLPVRQRSEIRQVSDGVPQSEVGEISFIEEAVQNAGNGHTPGLAVTTEEPGQDEAQEEEEEYQPLPYHHKPYEESVKKVKHTSAITVGSSSSQSQSVSSYGGPGLRGSVPELQIPRSDLPRPSSMMTLGSDGGIRGRTHSPHLSVGGSPSASPIHQIRGLSANRRTGDARPVSYVDLLNNVPYSQQVAPAPNLDNGWLRSAVGQNASLLDTRKTLEMYRANVKKTNDLSIQYEFAIFMINASSDEPDAQARLELLREARQILQKLADRSYPFAQYYLGDGYASGLFNKGKPDLERSFPLFVAASKHGHAEASYRAALCYEFGWGCNKSYPKAVQFFRAAASKNHPGAAGRLGRACLVGDMGMERRPREGLRWLKRAAESADAQFNSAPYELGQLHENGYGDDVFKDEAYAAQLFTQSADLGHPEASLRMGQAYEHGLLSCPRDPALSVHFYNGAAQAGVPEAMMALCAWYFVGAEPVLEKDENEAYEWSKRAAESGEFSLYFMSHREIMLES